MKQSGDIDAGKALAKGTLLRDFELIRKVVQRFRTTEREDLEAELRIKLLELKTQPPANVHNWEGYVAKFLFNKAEDLVRSWRARERRFGVPFEPALEFLPIERPVSHDESDDLLAILGMWADLDQGLKQLWLLLLEENGNRTRVASRLGKHRNTVAGQIRQIRRLLAHHGFRTIRSD